MSAPASSTATTDLQAIRRRPGRWSVPNAFSAAPRHCSRSPYECDASFAISQPIEAQIASLLQARDWTGASTVALRGYGPPVLTYLRRRLRDDDLASDVFSQFCEKV